MNVDDEDDKENRQGGQDEGGRQVNSWKTIIKTETTIAISFV